MGEWPKEWALIAKVTRAAPVIKLFCLGYQPGCANWRSGEARMDHAVEVAHVQVEVGGHVVLGEVRGPAREDLQAGLEVGQDGLEAVRVEAVGEEGHVDFHKETVSL